MDAYKITRFLVSAAVLMLVAACEGQTPETPVREALDPAAPSVGDDPRQPATSPEELLYVPGTAVVKFTEEATLRIEQSREPSALKAVREELGVSSMRRVFEHAGEYEPRTRREGLHRFYLVEFDKAVPLEKAAAAFEMVPGVESLEYQPKVQACSFDDSYYSNQWALSGSMNIHAEEVWNFCTGDPRVVVCVVDAGIDLSHPDLAYNCGPIHKNFGKSGPDIVPGRHGTHVAGIIAAVSNNGIGVAGIAGGDYAAGKRGVTLMSGQVFDDAGNAPSFASVIKWGADNGALISQNSWGYSYDADGDGVLSATEKLRALSATPSATDKAAIDYFRKYAGCDNEGRQLPDSPMKGGVVCFSSGNDGIANGVPSNYGPNIAVGATTSAGVLADYSNYGDWVDICAPGSSILSTVPGDSYANLSGTSMACPMVSGACALLCSVFGRDGFTNEDLEDILLSGADPSAIDYLSLNSGPYLNLRKSLEYGNKKYVREHNEQPVVIPEREGNMSFRQYEDIDIPFEISDPDGDKLLVETSIEGRAKFTQDPLDDSIWHLTLQCSQVNDFNPKKVEIYVWDMFGGSVKYEFTYTVVKNIAPKVAGAIDNFVLVGAESSRSIDIEGFFYDEDGEIPAVTVSASPSGTNLRIDGDRLIVGPGEYGLYEVTLTATDALRAKASYSFKYLARERDVAVDFYPNPVRDYLYIRSGEQRESLVVRLINALGSEVYAGELSCSAFAPGKLDMRGFAPGEYRISVQMPDGSVVTNKIVKR